MKAVFVPFDKQSHIKILGETLVAWDIPGFEPIAIEVKSLENETLIRVAAEAILAKKDAEYLEAEYIIAEIGSEPTISRGYKTYQKGQGIRVEACSPRVH